MQCVLHTLGFNSITKLMHSAHTDDFYDDKAFASVYCRKALKSQFESQFEPQCESQIESAKFCCNG